MSTNQTDILAGLSEEERYLYEERAAIREIDGGFPRHEAERLAMDEVLAGRNQTEGTNPRL